MKRKGFTLIELLVVIAVLAILAAILFPVMATARRKTRTTACLSNLRQIGMAINMYAQDQNEFYPYALDSSDKFTPEIWDDFFQRHRELVPPGVTSVRSWLQSMPMLHEVMMPYHKNKGIWRCPNDMGLYFQDFTAEPFHARPTLFEKYGSSYFFRTEIAFRRTKIMSFERNSEVNVMFDGGGAWHPGARIAREQSEARAYVDSYRYNVLYGDLHVKNVTFWELQAAWDVPLQSGWSPY